MCIEDLLSCSEVILFSILHWNKWIHVHFFLSLLAQTHGYMEWFGRICSALFSSAHFTQIQWCIKEIWEDCCRQWAVTTLLQILWAKASKGNRLLDKIYTFTAMDQALAHSPWVGLVSIYNFTSFMETLHCVPPYSGCLSEDMWVQQEHNTRISHGKPLLMEHREKRLAYFKLKWKGQYGQDRGFSGFTVQRWFLKAWSFSNVGGTVVPSISAIVLSLALCTCQHHCSLSQDKCWFCFIWGKPRQQLFDFSEIATASVCESLCHCRWPNSPDVFIVFFYFAESILCSSSATGPVATPPCEILCFV